ncbi:MAG: alkaline phosphatase family protein [Candidatus Aquicultorales bacterium]
MKKVVLVLMDGLADRRWPLLGGKTPLEAAETPNLDKLAARGLTGLIHPLGRGRAPSSELAHFALFGYALDEYPGRGVFEAAGHGIELKDSDVALHALFASVEREGDRLIVTERPSKASDEECRALLEACGGYESDGLKARAVITSNRQAMLIVEGGAEPYLTDTDPYYLDRPVSTALPVTTAEDLDAAGKTALLINGYLAHVFRIMDGHPINGVRRRKGLKPANFLLTKWPGRKRELQSFKERNGFNAASICSYPLYRGLAQELGMAAMDVPKSQSVREDMSARLEAAGQALTEGFDFVHLHVKATDDAGHEKDPELKKRVIEEIDEAMGTIESSHLSDLEVLLVVTGDHATPSGTDLLHSGDPVPLVMVGESAWPDGVTSFGETACLAGGFGQITGYDFMPTVLNLSDRVRYLGSSLTPRPTPYEPKSVVPFRLA